VSGWSLTSLPDATATAYAETITDLKRAITLHRRSESAGTAGAGGGGGSNLIAATCSCPRRIRVAAGTLKAGPIVCTICDTAFQPPPPA